MSCLCFFLFFLLSETFYMVFFDRNFFCSTSLHMLKQRRKPRSCHQNYGRLGFLCNAHALLTNPLRCPDTNQIHVDGHIRFVYATCGGRYFCIRIKIFGIQKSLDMITEFVLERTCPEEHPKSLKSVFFSE